MIYDYTFFKNHSKRRLTLQAPTVHYLCNPISDLFGSETKAKEHYQVISRPIDFDDMTPSIVSCYGAYYKGGQSVRTLEESLKTKLPEDFVQFYEQFGESAIITRSEPILIYPLQRMIDDFEDDPDIDIEEGRFFRFARYQDLIYLGLRKEDHSDEWRVIVCTYGLLYSEIVAPLEGGEHNAPSFYDWLKNLIETDGYPDKFFPRDPDVPYLTVVEDD